MFEEVISHISMHRSLLNGWWLVFILQLTWPFEVDQCAVSSESDFDGKERLVEVLNSKILKACNIKLTHFLATLVALVFTLHCTVELVSWSVVGWFQTSVTLRLATLFQAFDIGYCGCSSSTIDVAIVFVEVKLFRQIEEEGILSSLPQSLPPSS